MADEMDRYGEAVEARMDAILDAFTSHGFDPQIVPSAKRIAAAVMDECSAIIGLTVIAADDPKERRLAEHYLKESQAIIRKHAQALRDQ